MRTTLLGVLTIVASLSGAAISIINGEPVDFPTVAAAIAAGFGLIKAADN